MKDVIEKIKSDIARYNTCALPYGSGNAYPVGCEGVEYRMRSETLSFMLSVLDLGETLKNAAELAKSHARKLVSQHNSLRKRDINWARWDGTADNAVDDILRFNFQNSKHG